LAALGSDRVGVTPTFHESSWHKEKPLIRISNRDNSFLPGPVFRCQGSLSWKAAHKSQPSGFLPLHARPALPAHAGESPDFRVRPWLLRVLRKLFLRFPLPPTSGTGLQRSTVEQFNYQLTVHQRILTSSSRVLTDSLTGTL
jgi:hypothetical protein